MKQLCVDKPGDDPCKVPAGRSLLGWHRPAPGVNRPKKKRGKLSTIGANKPLGRR